MADNERLEKLLAEAVPFDGYVDPQYITIRPLRWNRGLTFEEVRLLEDWYAKQYGIPLERDVVNDD